MHGLKGRIPGNKKGKKLSPESLQLFSNVAKDRVWYNNGEKEIQLLIGEEIPEGFVKGRLKSFITDYQREKARETCYKNLSKRWGKDYLERLKDK